VSASELIVVEDEAYRLCSDPGNNGGKSKTRSLAGLVMLMKVVATVSGPAKGFRGLLV